MRVVVHGHAVTHGLTDKQIVSAYLSGYRGAVIRRIDRSTEPQRWSCAGFDDEGRAIQIVFVWLHDRAALVFHASYLTKQFRKELREARRTP